MGKLTTPTSTREEKKASKLTKPQEKNNTVKATINMNFEEKLSELHSMLGKKSYEEIIQRRIELLGK